MRALLSAVRHPDYDSFANPEKEIPQIQWKLVKTLKRQNRDLHDMYSVKCWGDKVLHQAREEILAGMGQKGEHFEESVRADWRDYNDSSVLLRAVVRTQEGQDRYSVVADIVYPGSGIVEANRRALSVTSQPAKGSEGFTVIDRRQIVEPYIFDEVVRLGRKARPLYESLQAMDPSGEALREAITSPDRAPKTSY